MEHPGKEVGGQGRCRGAEIPGGDQALGQQSGGEAHKGEDQSIKAGNGGREQQVAENATGKGVDRAGGDFALMGDGKLKLDSLPASCQLLEGDLVVTSGLGGYLPPDLVIGSVSELRADDSDTSNYAILTPVADLNGLTEVCIIKSFEIVS